MHARLGPLIEPAWYQNHSCKTAQIYTFNGIREAKTFDGHQLQLATNNTDGTRLTKELTYVQRTLYVKYERHLTESFSFH